MDGKQLRMKQLGWQAFFTGPTILAFAMAIGFPFVFGFYMSFLQLEGISAKGEFVGFVNYMEAFADERYWKSLWTTLQYMFFTVIFANLLAFGMAFLVTAGTRGQNFVRASLFMPNMIGGIVLGYIWVFVLGRVVPTIGEKYALEFLPVSIFGDEQQAFWALVGVTVWQTAGYMMIILIAGLMNVPRDLIEASMIDGANAWQRLKSITMPLMVPAFLITIFLTMRNSFLVFDLNYSLTAGEPYNSTELISMYLVGKAFNPFVNEFGIAQAEAIILFVIIAFIAWAQFSYGKKREVQA